MIKHTQKQRFLFLLILIFSVKLAYSSNNQSNPNKNNSQDSIVHQKRVYNTLRINNPPVIDGRLDDDCWKLGEWQSNYSQLIPVYNAKPSLKTELKVLYNDQSIFVAIRAYDDMDKVTRRLGRRDNFDGDLVGVQFDSYFDHRTGFEFDITSAGQKLDVWLFDDSWDVNWDAVWYAKVAYEDSAWTAEFEIPLSQLRYGSSKEQVWGFNSWRKIDRLQEEDHWNLVANDGTGLIYTFGELHGLKGLPKNRRIEMAPYVSGKITTSKRIPENSFAKGSKFDGQGGLDAKIGITNNFTLDATINPDFGQVEADPSILNLSAFEIYFEEKRPFFVEGKSFFDFKFDEDQLFYTRRIGHAPSYTPSYDTIRMPDFTTIGGALKLSGKTANGLSVGVIESVALKETADIHYNNTDLQQTVEPLTNYFIARLQKDYNRGNTIIGGILTHTHRAIRDDHLNFLSRNALTYGLDFTKFWADRKYFIDAKVIGSHIDGDEEAIRQLQTSSARYFQRPDIRNDLFDSTRTTLNGWGGSIKMGKWSKGHWRYNEEVIMRSSGLELNDLGFMPLSNILKNNTNILYVEKENQWIFKTYTLDLLQQNAWNAQGDGLYSLVDLSVESEFKNSWTVCLSGQYKFRTIDQQLLRGGFSMKVPNLMEYNWSIYSNRSKKIYAGISGTHIHRQSGSAKYFTMTSDVSYRPWPNLALSLQSTYLRHLNELQYIGQFEDASSNQKWLLGTVDNRNLSFTFRADFALTPELTIQYYGSPFVSIGKYFDFKEVTNPRDADYHNRFKILSPEKDGSLYHFDNNGDNVVDFSIEIPDFNYQQFRSNLVLRWEYKAGSTVYFVWSQDRTAFEPLGSFSFNDGYNQLFRQFPKNIFIVKVNYWLPL